MPIIIGGQEKEGALEVDVSILVVVKVLKALGEKETVGKLAYRNAKERFPSCFCREESYYGSSVF